MAFASARRASNFIFSCNAYSSSTGNGGVKISFDITGTGTMTSIGVTQIDIKNSAGTIVKTFKNTQSGYGYMIVSNTMYHESSITYSGTAGSSYYAVVYFKAANSSGSDTSTVTTLTVKA